MVRREGLLLSVCVVVIVDTAIILDIPYNALHQPISDKLRLFKIHNELHQLKLISLISQKEIQEKQEQ